MDSTEGLEGFVAIVEEGSLTSAAALLGVPRPTLSRQLARLERRLGVRLLHRTTRRIVATRAGEELFHRARVVVAEAKAALEAVRRHDDVPRGLLRVTTAPGVDDVLAVPILAFLERWPEVELELHATPRVIDLVAEGFDVAIRGQTGDRSDGIARTLLRTDLVAVASPAYLDRRGRPASAAELGQHALILGFYGGSSPERTWPLRDGGTLPVKGRLATDDLLLRRAAATRGDGIALLPYPMVMEAVRAGRLERVLPDVVGFRGAAGIVYPERAFLQAKVRAFVDHLVAWAAAQPADACTEGR